MHYFGFSLQWPGEPLLSQGQVLRIELPMTFDELLALVSSGDSLRIRMDSRLVEDGDIFAAVGGIVYDGHDFIDRAVANGAKYIVCQRQPVHPENQAVKCEYIVVEDSSTAAAVLAQAVRGNPASLLTNLAVTGTNGKTTVAFLTQSVIRNAGEKCGLIGTVVYDTGVKSRPANLTTPDCLAIAEMTEQMLKAGSRYMVIEASSHALCQNRLAGIEFEAAAFTNLAGDHLDYHKSQEEYLAAKAKLFQGLSADAVAVLNKQSAGSQQIAERTSARILWYGVDEPADITAHIESMGADGTVFVLGYANQSQKVKTSLLGAYNVSNHLAAAGLSLAAGFDLEATAAGLSAVRVIPGRLEKVDWGGNFSVLVDYAHSDDALKNTLATIKPLCKGRLRVVFGCGGDRDRTKRPRMAKVAEQFADFVIVTSDNPRTEKPEDIISEAVTGFEKPDSPTITLEPDRKKAIEFALKSAARDDIVLIAGRGHEAYQIIGKDRVAFHDATVARQCLKRLK